MGTLAAELTDTATALAARFDARNGTAYQSEVVARRLAVQPVGEHLPLSASLRRRPIRTPEPAPADVAGAEPVRVPAGASAEDLLALADECWRTHRTDDCATVLKAYDERFGDAELPAATVARRLELRAGELNDDGDPSASIEANRVALAAWRAVPDPVRAQVVAGRLGALLCMTDEGAEEGLALARESADQLDRHGDQRERAAAHDRLALAYVHRSAGPTRWTRSTGPPPRRTSTRGWRPGWRCTARTSWRSWTGARR